MTHQTVLRCFKAVAWVTQPITRDQQSEEILTWGHDLT